MPQAAETSDLDGDPGQAAPGQPGDTRPLTRPGWGALATLLGVSVFFGTTFVSIKVSVEVFSPVAVAGLRLWLGAILVGGFVWLGSSAPVPAPPVRPASKRGRRAWPVVGFVGVVGYALPFSLVAHAETRIDAAMAGLLMASSPVAALLLAPFLTADERLTRRRIFGALFGVGGVALALGPRTSGAAELGAGLCVVAAAICYALAGFAARRIAWPIDRLTAGALVTAALVLTPVALLYGNPVLAAPQPRHVVAIVYLGLLPTAVSYVLRFRLIVRHGYTFVSYGGYLVPVLSLVAGHLVLGESLSPAALAALGLILAGVWIGHRA